MGSNPDCTNCRWNARDQIIDEQKKPIVGQYQYTCHRFPPSAFMVPGPAGSYRLASAFPVVTAGMVCSLHDFPDSTRPAALELINNDH